MPFPLLVAFVLGLAPAGIGPDAGVDAGPVSLDVDGGVDLEAGPASLRASEDGVDLEAGPASLRASEDGVDLQTPLTAPVAVPICVDCRLDPLLRSRDGAVADGDPSPASTGIGAVIADASPAEVATGTSMAAVLMGAAVWLARAAGFLPWFSSFSRIEDDKLAEHPTRRQALDFIAANPGATLQDVRRALGIAWGTTVHHLGRLERAGLVAVRRVGGKRGHWPLGQAPARDALPESGRALAALVLAEPGLPQGELARRTGLLAPAACKHLARLESAGLVAARREGKQRLYLPTRQLAATLA